MKNFYLFCFGVFMCFILSSCDGSGGGVIGSTLLESGFGGVSPSISPSVYTIQINPSSGTYSVGQPINFSITITKDGSNFDYNHNEVIISTFKDSTIGGFMYGNMNINVGGSFIVRYIPNNNFTIKSGNGTFGFTATYKDISTRAEYTIN